MTDVEPDGEVRADVAVIGSGMGGATLAWALRETGARVLVVERGRQIPRGRQNSSVDHVIRRRAHHTTERWRDGHGRYFRPRTHYVVGGNTRFYGACLARFRESDFGEVPHREGISPAWPFGYADLEPYYGLAERLYGVHGDPVADPTEPARSRPLLPPVPLSAAVVETADRLRGLGLHPAPLPLALDVGEGGSCTLCATCDGFPCAVDGKGDADVRALRPALASGNVGLLDRTRIARLQVGQDGRRVVAALGRRDGRPLVVKAGTFVVACGAVNSAALLLRSACAEHPDGLANRSGLVGRRYMTHNSTRLLAVGPPNWPGPDFAKTIWVNDFYRADPHPFGNLQLTGRVYDPGRAGGWHGVGAAERELISASSMAWQAISEDLPDPRNRVQVDRGGRLTLSWTPNNLSPHRELVSTAVEILHAIGYPRVETARASISAVSHQCGTVVAGTDPTRSVLDGWCRSHDVPNLFVVDASFFPSSAALNPALTVAAQALRVAAEGGLLP